MYGYSSLPPFAIKRHHHRWLIAAGAPQNALRFPCPKELVIMLS